MASSVRGPQCGHGGQWMSSWHTHATRTGAGVTVEQCPRRQGAPVCQLSRGETLRGGAKRCEVHGAPGAVRRRRRPWEGRSGEGSGQGLPVRFVSIKSLGRVVGRIHRRVRQLRLGRRVRHRRLAGLPEHRPYLRLQVQGWRLRGLEAGLFGTFGTLQ